jgi:hypothetical protein
MGEAKRRRQNDPNYGRSRELTIYPIQMDEFRDNPFASPSERQTIDWAHMQWFQLWLIRGSYRGRDVAVAVLGDNRLAIDTHARADFSR